MARLGYPYLALTVMLIALVATSVVAHVPLFGGGGGGLNEAREVDDPTKSWVIYTTYDGPGHVDYYRMSLKEGDLISLGLIVPASEGDRGFAPDIVLMGPGLEHDDAFPSQVQRADGGYIVIGSEEPSHLMYEPFSPSTFYEMAGIEITAPADGDYYVAVYDDSDGGEYGLVVGKTESFTLADHTLLAADGVPMGGAAVVGHPAARDGGLPHRLLRIVVGTTGFREKDGC